MLAGRALEEIEEAFISASFNAGGLDPALELVSRLTLSCGTLLFATGSKTLCSPVPEPLAASTEFYIANGWEGRDERYKGLPALRSRGVFVDSDFASPEDIETHPYYRGFLQRFDLRWCAGVAIKAPHDLLCMSIQRTIDQGPFSAREQRRLSILSRRLTRCARLIAKIDEARAWGALDAFSALALPAILLEKTGRVLRMNAQAVALESAGVLVRAGRIQVQDVLAASELEQAFRMAEYGAWVGIASPIPIRRPDALPLVLHVIGLPLESNPFLPARCVVLIADPASGSKPYSDRSISHVFGLTRAEARLAALLAEGHSLDTASELAGITYETARSRLKAILAKTSMDRQGSLIALLARAFRF